MKYRDCVCIFFLFTLVNSHALLLLISVFEFNFAEERMPSRRRVWEEKGLQLIQIIQVLVFWDLINLKCFFLCRIVVYSSNYFYATSKKITEKTKTPGKHSVPFFHLARHSGKRYPIHSITVFYYLVGKQNRPTRGGNSFSPISRGTAYARGVSLHIAV